jgi:hypothetical protein
MRTPPRGVARYIGARTAMPTCRQSAADQVFLGFAGAREVEIVERSKRQDLEELMDSPASPPIYPRRARTCADSERGVQ